MDAMMSMSSLSTDFTSATINSLFIILATEIGDKTFFIAAVLAMRNARLAVYSGAMAALTVMHVLSAGMGYALPNLIPKAYTHMASTLLSDSREMSADGPSDELHEVEEELESKKRCENASHDDDALDALEGQRDIIPQQLSFLGSAIGVEKLKIFTQALTLTFLAEWGDRSQIATIALASAKNPYGVIIGGLVGHALCTGVAVLGGRILAAKISEKMVAIIGGSLFLFFAFTSFIYGPDAV